MKAKNLFLYFLFIICCNAVFFGQTQDYINNVIPPSPNAASLGKYVEAPVSLATGIPNIGIPIYTITEGPISVPISLSYHAGGIKVEEVASWVGLGWSLNAGGVITRSTRGLPDDSNNGYINMVHSVDDMANVIYMSGEWYSIISEVLSNTRDYEPDVFSFNFLGYSGRFIYDQNANKFIQSPLSNIEIAPNYDATNGRILSWTITTPDGMKYYFGKSFDLVEPRAGVDYNSVSANFSASPEMAFAQQNDIPSHINAWYLMDIVAPTNHHVKFTYQTQENVTQFYKSQESFMTGGCSNDYTASFSQSFSNISVIKEIEFSNGKIEFVPDGLARLDLENAKALNRINLYEKNSLWKSFNLYHEYFVSNPEVSKWANFGDVNQRRYRLKLLAVEEENYLGEKKPPYIFEYNPISLPSRFSNAQDYWGYYNAMNLNRSLIPETFILPNIYTGDANRTVDEQASQASILTKVIYPTGGSAEYFYESNTCLYGSIVSEMSIGYNLRNRLDPKHVEFYKDPIFLNNSPNYEYATEEFTIGPNLVGQINFSDISVTGCDNTEPLTSIGCDFLLEIFGVTDPNFKLQVTSTNFAADLPPGKYRIGALGRGTGEQTLTNFSITMSWGEDPYPGYLIMGGLRIKKIILTDENNSNIEKRYEYNSFGTNQTSGYALSSPVFLNTQFFNGSCTPPQYVSKITSYSQAPMSFVKGNILGYKNVTELRKDDSKTEYTFSKGVSFAHQSTGSGDGVIHLPEVYADWTRGNLLKEDAFKFESGNYHLVKSVVNEYEEVERSFVYNLGLSLNIHIKSDPNLAEKTSHGFYSGVSEWYRLKNTTTTNYFGTNEVVEKQEFIYDNNQLLASAVKSYKSAGDTLINKTYYAPEMGLTTLVNEHRIAEPIKQQSYKKVGDNSNLLSTQLTIYDTTYAGGLTLPHYIQTSKGGNALENRVEFYDYDNYGNVKEVSKLDDKHTIYLWGYNKTKPIAKITGATYSAVQPYEASLQALSDFDTDAVSEGVFRTSLNNFRSSLPNAKIETYTYDPLVGMTSATNERGQTTFYEYDGFGRLSVIRNDDGDIVKKYDYNYQTATANFLYVADPFFEPVSGNYEDSLYVKIKGLTPGSQVYFAFGDTIPDETSYLYGDSIFIPGGMDTIINAIALLEGYNPSNVVTGNYSVSCKVDSILFDSIPGTYEDSLKVGISCKTPDVSIYYTLDGTEPDETSTLYTEPVFMPIGFTTTIKAKAYSDICASSEVYSATYTVTCETAAPDFSHISETYPSSIDVTLSCETENATIYYTTDDSEPNDTKTLYNGTPITLLEGTTTTIKAIAYSGLCNQSTVVSADYTIECYASEPTFSPGSGDYDWPQSVELGATAGEIIYYAFGDTVPDESCRQYSSAIPLEPGTSTLNARAFKNGCNPGTHVSHTYNVTQLKVANPVITPTSQNFTNSISVSITCDTIGATIYYTDDNSDPKTNGQVYSGDLTITSTKTIRAYAVKTNYFDSDEAIPRTYTIQVAQPDISPSSRDFTGSMDVTFYCSTPGATIYYSSNGLPTTSSPSTTNGGKITITDTKTFNAFAVKAGYADSEYAYPKTYTDEPLCTLSVSPGSGAVNPCGGVFNVATVTATGATPAVTNKPSWVTSASIVGTTLTLNCEPNTTGSYRDGIITITAGACTETFTVQQNTLTLEVPDKTITACAQQGASVPITSNVCSFGAPQESLDWISNASIVSGNLVFDCTENETGSSRSGTITISGNGMIKNVTVTQQANTDEFDIINTSGAIDPLGGPTKTFIATVSSNLNWHPYVPTEKIGGWLQATPVGNTIVFTADKNDYDFRDVTLKISVPGTCHNLLDSITISQDHTPCNVSVDSPYDQGLSFPAGGGTQGIAITTNKTQVNFSCPDGVTVTENGSFYDVHCGSWDQITSRTLRIGITVEGGICNTFLDIVQAGAVPYLTLNPTFKNADPDGENFVVTVNTNLPDYNVVESAGWIGFTKAADKKSVSFVIEPNDSGSFRTYDVEFKDLSGTLMQTFRISQDPNCSFSLITSESSIPAAGISQANAIEVLVSTTEASYNVSVPDWMYYSGPDQNNLILVWCDENPEITPRPSVIEVKALGAEGSICYAQEVLTQAGANPYLNLSQSSISENSDAGTYSITASNNFSNNFTVTIPPEHQSWIIHNRSGALVSFTLAENTTSSNRTANITISGEGLDRTLTITQERFIGRVSLTPLTGVVGAVNDQVSIQVTSNASWTVTKDVSWLSVTPVSGSGNGSVIVTCTADPNDGGPGLPQSGQIIFTPSSGGVARSVTIDFVPSQQPD